MVEFMVLGVSAKLIRGQAKVLAKGRGEMEGGDADGVGESFEAEPGGMNVALDEPERVAGEAHKLDINRRYCVLQCWRLIVPDFIGG